MPAIVLLLLGGFLRGFLLSAAALTAARIAFFRCHVQPPAVR
jgi:hypothetical protein